MKIFVSLLFACVVYAVKQDATLHDALSKVIDDMHLIEKEFKDDDASSSCTMVKGKNAVRTGFRLEREWTGKYCINRCAELRKTDNRINGVTVTADGSNENCYCNQGMTGFSSDPKFDSCLFTGAAPEVPAPAPEGGDICTYPPAVGTGTKNLRRFYWNAQDKRCLPFIYSGNGGNANNFKKGKLCKAACDKSSHETNGRWSSWGEWGPCSAKCGRGRTTRSRQCNNPAPSAGGKPCRGKDQGKGWCNVKCAAKWSCTLVQGQAPIAASSTLSANEAEGKFCTDHCSERKEKDSTINGATVFDHNCYCNRGMTGLNPNPEYSSCSFDEKRDVTDEKSLQKAKIDEIFGELRDVLKKL